MRVYESVDAYLKQAYTPEQIAKQHKVNISDILSAFEVGRKIEMEHTDDVDVANTIASHHLMELPDYYDENVGVPNMERELKLEESAYYDKIINESVNDILSRSRGFSKELKDETSKYVNSATTYKKGKFWHLTLPTVITTKYNKARGLGFGADKNGFFVHTHRARSKSKPTPDKIPISAIKFIESTG